MLDFLLLRQTLKSWWKGEFILAKQIYPYFLFSLLLHCKIGKSCDSFDLYGNLLNLMKKKNKIKFMIFIQWPTKTQPNLKLMFMHSALVSNALEHLDFLRNSLLSEFTLKIPTAGANWFLVYRKTKEIKNAFLFLSNFFFSIFCYSFILCCCPWFVNSIQLFKQLHCYLQRIIYLLRLYWWPLWRPKQS